ncbi:hypothetical protein [Lysobacter gummosus]|uniref:hypothetical protein n=1 Tax=Lysobacter gummosus TaxID=262324 RepID=UPI0011DF0E74|nr:hypothetical protein [Lysobacter gummosus]
MLAHHRKKQIPRAMKASSNIEPTQRAAPFFKGGELTRLFEIAAVAVPPPFEKGGAGGDSLLLAHHPKEQIPRAMSKFKHRTNAARRPLFQRGRIDAFIR